MVSKLSTFLIVAVVVIGLDAKCSEKPTEITSTTITTVKFLKINKLQVTFISFGGFFR